MREKELIRISKDTPKNKLTKSIKILTLLFESSFLYKII